MEAPLIKTVLDQIAQSPTRKLLGWQILDARPTDGWLKASFDGKKEFCNAAGFVNGGILAAMLESSMGLAQFVMTEGKSYSPTISLTVNFMASAKPGPIIAEAKVVQSGKTIVFMEGRLTAEDGALLATATATGRLVEAARALR